MKEEASVYNPGRGGPRSQQSVKMNLWSPNYSRFIG